MTKQELYRDLCVEAGTRSRDDETSADDWYAASAHNVTADLDATLAKAAAGDVAALAEARQAVGLPVFV